MRKVFVLACVLLIFALVLTGCNKQMMDFTFKYDTVVLQQPDGTVVKGKCQSWTDFEDGDQLQVKVDGKTYLVHSMNCVLIDE